MTKPVAYDSIQILPKSQRYTMSNLRLFLLQIVVVLVLCIVHATGEIIKDPIQCGRIRCQVPVDRKFKYLENLYYQYHYRVDVRAHLSPQLLQSNNSGLYIDADVTLHFLTPCEGSLRFGNVSISHDRIGYQPDFPDRAGAEFKSSLERRSLRFSFDDGIIHELCSNINEEIWVLNFKRGVLSMLQNTMLRFDVDRRYDELDVNGICQTHYSLYQARHTSLIMHKIKDLDSCRFSAKHLSLIQSESYHSPFSRVHQFIQPLFISSSECEITIDHNIYQQVKCRDYHQLRPLSHGEKANTRTEINSCLELIAELRTSPDLDDYEKDNKSIMHWKRSNLLYDHTKSPRTIYGELRTSRDLLKIMCIMGAPQELQENFSDVFTKFIHSARMLDYQGLSQLYHRAQGICETGRRHIINALPFIGSNAAIHMMTELILKKIVDQNKVSLWVTAFALIPRPDKHTLYALAPLLDFQKEIVESQLILSYSSVIHAYCSIHGSSCENFKPIKEFIKFVENFVEYGCHPRVHSQTEIKQVLESLKAIGNSGVETNTLLYKLKKCIMDQSGFIPIEIKLAAVEAHRRLPSCERSRDEFFLDYYRNFTVDTELRIASYLQLMRCPDYSVIKVIRHTLEVEEVNQVGSFIWSHLRSMLSSSSPTRIEIQSLLTDRDLGNKFNNDLRKFSRNYEKSFFSEEYNFGANYQTNLIFSPKSYIPRTASFNLTVDLFGESINLFELNMRVEGFEFYAENLFGPNGPFSSANIGEKFYQFLRYFRSVDSPKNNKEYWNSVKKLPNVIDNNYDHPRVSIGYKIFGNEIKFAMLNSDQEIRRTLASLNPWEKVKQILSGKEIVHYDNSAMFLDSLYILPTTAGLPIKLDVSGSAACNIKLSGILDSKKLISEGKFEIKGNIVPSLSVDITGTMTVDAFYKSVGIKLKSSIYSAGAVETDFNIEHIKLAKLSWRIPSNKMDVLSLTTDVLFISMNGAVFDERPLDYPSGNLKEPKQEILDNVVHIIKNTTCSWSALDRLIGLKLCADYQFPNNTRSNASYLILNGPTKFKLSLIKADPTADSYLLEYRWNRTKNNSIIRFAFDTPGSQMQREISATVCFDTLNNNVTLVVKSKGNSLVAQGTYKRTDDEIFIDIGLDSNGTKHLDSSFGYSRKSTKFGIAYTPKLLLTINNERIVNLSGIIRNQDKNNSSQCDIDLRFETKNLSSHVFGFIFKGNNSIAGNIKVEYRFHERFKDEVLQTEFSLINKSIKTLTFKAADMKVHSTAYPQMNLVAGLRYQHAIGHIELYVEINTSPHLHDADRHKLTAQFITTYSKPYFQTDGANISAYVALLKPVQNIDVKIGADYHSVGSKSETCFLIRYAPGKEITLAIDIIMPRGSLLAVESRANLTIPNFSSMLISAKITETLRNEYNLVFAGTWFSGHNISAEGIYYDRSTIVIANHNLRILLKSPSFNKDILLNCKLYHDAMNFRIGLFVEQVGSDKYTLILNHTSISINNFRTFLEIKYKNSTYSILSDLNFEREVALKLHLDMWRDVYVSATSINEDTIKKYGLQVKWDAIRDPKMKFVASIQLNNFFSVNNGKDLGAILRISYPHHIITSSCLFAVRAHNNYIINANLAWSDNREITLSIDTDYDAQNLIKVLKLESQLVTPFENWKKTSLNGKYLQTESEITASGSAYWQDSQYISFDITGNNKSQDNATKWNAHCGVTSSLHTIQYVIVDITQMHEYAKSADLHIVIMYHPDKIIDVRSIWLIENIENNIFNVTGNFQLISPVANYRKGELKGHLSLRSNWKFYGAVYMDMDKRKYAGHLIGDLTRIKESMVQFNITTPIEKYAYIHGSFGLSEANRHIVAEVATPAGPLGFEGICQLFTSTYDFNVKLLVATPIDILQQVFIIAKFNHQEADFRAAFNNMTVGFQGVWFYNNITDFHYSYILYTPLQGFHEIGITTKLITIYADTIAFFNIDTEFTLRVVELKMGIKAHAGPKSPPLVLIPLKPEANLFGDIKQNICKHSENSENKFYWKAGVQLDTVIMETISGSFNFDHEGYTDKILGELRLPQGTIIIEDKFCFEDFFNIKNDISIDLPYQYASEIICIYSFNVDMENSIYLMELRFNINNNSEWIESGFNINYTYQGLDEEEPQTHFMKLDLKMPINVLQSIHSKSTLEIDENYYKANVSIRTEQSSMELIGSFEQDSNYVDMTMQTNIDSPIIIIPKTRIIVKKDFTDKEKHIDICLEICEPEIKLIKIEVSWLSEDTYLRKVSLGLNTWIEPLMNLQIFIVYNNSMELDNTIFMNGHFKHHNDQNYSLSGKFRNGKIEAELQIPIQAEPLFFNGTLTKIDENIYQLIGDLTTSKTSKISHIICPIIVNNGILSSLNVIITEGDAHTNNENPILFKLKKEKYNWSLEGECHQINGSFKINFINLFDWDLRIILYKENTKFYNLVTFMNVQINGNTTLYFEANVPWEQANNFVFNGNLLLNREIGNIYVKHKLNQDSGHILLFWRLFYLSDMIANAVVFYQKDRINTIDINAVLFYANPNKAFENVDIGFDINIDQGNWRLGSNITIGIQDQNNIDGILKIRLPPPNNDVHNFLINYHSIKNHQELSYIVGYSTDCTRSNYASDGSIIMNTNDIAGHLRLTWGLQEDQTINNQFYITLDHKKITLKYSLFTPQLLHEETLILLIQYDDRHKWRTLIKTELYYPGKTQVGSAQIFYHSLNNINGTINASTSLPILSKIKCEFTLLTNLKQNKRFVQVFWNNNSALLDSDCIYNSKLLDLNLDGHIRLEFPLNTRHVTLLTYGYKKQQLITTGYSELIYNGAQIIEGLYTAKSEARAGFEKDRIEITIKNCYKPLCIIYQNRFEYSISSNGTNYPSLEYKEVNIYQLNNLTAFNVSGTSYVRTTNTGQEIELTAIHTNRTVKFCTNYDIRPGMFKLKSWFNLAKDAWISFNIDILNKTADTIDNQFIIMSLTYPKRNFTLDTSYLLTKSQFNSEAQLIWKSRLEEKKILGVLFDWTNSSLGHSMNQQIALLKLKHPSFKKDVSVIGIIKGRNSSDLLNMALKVDYSIYENKLLILSAILRDESDILNERKYSYFITGQHPKTQLKLNIRGHFKKYKAELAEAINNLQYKRSFLPEETSKILGRLDLNRKEIELSRISNEYIKYFQTRYYTNYPLYMINGSIISGQELNMTSVFFINLHEKLALMVVNYTPDGADSLRMHGKVPNARNAELNIWRTYDEDVIISDLSFYLRLNHSRLVTSKLKWRPELKSDITNIIRMFLTKSYEELSNDINYWRQYIRSETISAMFDIWTDARDELQEFLDDLNDLKEVQNDFVSLKIYLNNSYDANDFYIKDIVLLTIYIVDELSLRTHIQTLPTIINEIWEIMGESGEAIRNSLQWIIETLKNAYQKLSEIANAILKGDLMNQIANIVEKLIIKYDMFVKNLHVSFIKYIENLYNKIYQTISLQWHRFLIHIEPIFIQLAHYLETVGWKAVQEFFNFLYDRKIELITSPYYDHFSNFTQDIDKLYRDIKANNIIINIHKYSTTIIQFIKDRYFAFVPFSKELKDVFNEIINEFKELKKLPSVSYTFEKIHHIYSRAVYIYQYLEVREKLESIIKLIHFKLMDISQSALQAETKYREAKTKLIFNPNNGLVCLEQKLPMSWHAFNQTPEFTEIPEFRAIVDMSSYFTTSNTTFWTLYYQIKPVTEPCNWLPPFKAQAMIVGARHFRTFDGLHYDLNGFCTYLIARDFIRNHFAILIKYERNSENTLLVHQIIVLLGNKAVQLDVFRNSVKLVGERINLQLPVELDNSMYFVYQEESILTIEHKNKELKFECNLKYIFCKLELAGWYYGKTAGLFGTMDNEPANDLLASNGSIIRDIGKFAYSWSLEREIQCNDNKDVNIVRTDDGHDILNAAIQFCLELFTNQSSEFSSCFNIVNPKAYRTMCIKSIDDREACSIAMSYLQTCMFYDTFLRIPDKCTTCSISEPYPSIVPEGDFRKLEGDMVPKSVDVIFIVEAKECNRGIRENRSIEQLVVHIKKELNDNYLMNIRWSVVIFGGNGVYEKPRSLVLDNQIFTRDATHFINYFDHMPVGKGNEDIFGAIRYATQLLFRAGVSKTFILMPCSHCEAHKQTLDYTVLYHALQEHGITLHILMESKFQFEKIRLNKIFYGFDATRSYTKKDFRMFNGDIELRRQVKLPKSVLGYCAPLALETNGSIFSGSKLSSLEKLGTRKKFASVFARRVAFTAKPSNCQLCECIANNDGISKMECGPCNYPIPVTVDFVSETFNEDDSTTLQSTEEDYGQIDIDEE